MAASLSAFGKKGLFRSQKWLHLMRELPCAVCGSEDGTVVAAHRNEGKGMGLKVSDCLVIPLCFVCHREFDKVDKAVRRNATLGTERILIPSRN